MTSKKKQKLQEDIINEFKPIFDESETEEGIPMVDLEAALRESNLPDQILKRFLTSADEDQNRLITYSEFGNQIRRENEETLQKLSRVHRFLNFAMQAVAPDRIEAIHVEPDSAVNYNWGDDDKVELYVKVYDCKPPPFMIPLITLVEIIVFIVYAVKLNTDNDKTNDITGESGLPITSPLVYSPYRRTEVWRFFTYMLIHQGYLHLVFNCIIQLMLGTTLEMVHKFWRVGIVYMLGVLAGSLAHSCFDSRSYLVGASGGCYALIGAHFANIVTNWETMQKQWLQTPRNFLCSGVFQLMAMIILTGGDTAIAIYDRFSTEIPTNIGFSTHFGGILAGFLIGVPVLRNIKIQNWEKICFWICLALYCIFMIAGIIFNTVCAPKFCNAVNYELP